MTRLRPVIAVATAAACLVPLTSAMSAAKTTCTEQRSGGDWSTYGQSLMGQQRQTAEHTMTTANVGTLEEAWRADSTVVQSAPPVVAGGCVFLNANGTIEARDLDTGAIVWRAKDVNTAGTFAPMVVDGRVHFTTAEAQLPRAAALDQRTGRLLWESDEITFGAPANQMGSAIVYKGIQVVFTTGPDNDVNAKQGYALIDARTGRILYQSLTLPKADREKGLVGGGAWGTPTVDPATGYAYVGTSNPESKQGESKYDDAILKLDLDRRRPTFGHIVATYKGTPDSVTGYDNPVCQTVGGVLWYNAGTYGASPTCGQIDVDFGVGPTLWRDPKGRLLAAATQKYG
jgi:alcohol dehydrogenase (cytochrome c)